MQLVYIDDAKADGVACFAGLMISAARWLDAVAAWHGMLVRLRDTRGFRTTRELHATKLLSGHGNYFHVRPSLEDCVETHVEVLHTIASLPTARLFLCADDAAREFLLFERLMERVQRALEHGNDHAMLVCDNGKTYDDSLNRLRPAGLMRVSSGATSRPLTRIVEDIVYRDSKHSVLVQAADACVYTVLRKERPLARLSSCGFDRAFSLLARISVREAAPFDAP